MLLGFFSLQYHIQTERVNYSISYSIGIVFITICLFIIFQKNFEKFKHLTVVSIRHNTSCKFWATLFKLPSESPFLVMSIPALWATHFEYRTSIKTYVKIAAFELTATFKNGNRSYFSAENAFSSIALWTNETFIAEENKVFKVDKWYSWLMWI